MSSMNVDVRKQKKKQIAKKTSSSHHHWTKKEDDELVECLHVLVEDPKWNGDNGTLRVGCLSQLEKILEERLSTSNLRVNPHIESRVKLLKRQYNAICEMISIGSGFGLNDTDKCLTAPKDAFDGWVKTHLHAKGLRNKSFPHFDDFVIIFEKDRATGQRAETAADAVEDNDDDDDDDDEDMLQHAQEMDNDGFQDETKVGRNEVDASTCRINILTNTRSESSKKRARSSDGLSELVEEISHFRSAFQEATQEIKSIASFFKKDSEGSDRRMTVFNEIMQLEGFSRDKVLNAGEYITKDSHKVDFFFAMPSEYRRDYVIKQLHECHSYRASCDFPPSGEM